MIVVREIKVEDGAKYLQLCKELDRETKYRPYDPGERDYDVAEQVKRIIETIDSGNRNSNIFVAEDGEELVGYVAATGSGLNRLKHITRIGIAIKQAYCGQGIGVKLFESLEAWARVQKLHRLELTVMTDNPGAKRLYEKMGFEVEGIKRHSLLIDGEYADDYYMCKLI